MNRQIVVLQYAGDFAEAFWRLRAGGPENYAAQAYSLDAVASLVDPATRVASVCCQAAKADDQVLPNGVRSIALGFPDAVDPARVWRAVDALRPTHLLLRTPMVPVLAAARRRGIPVVATFADSFVQGGPFARMRYQALARELNDPNVLVVGNHGRNACRNLERIGVRPQKVVPWDWPQASSDLPPKRYPARAVWTLLYAGLVDRHKGVGDAIEAMALLRRDGVRTRLQCFGSGALADFRRLAAAGGVQDCIDFAGQAANPVVCAAMRQADVILVPSRHSYPEGVPLTIYEAFRSRTPIVGSDHPMFDGILVDGYSAKVFRAAHPAELAGALRALRASPQTYETLSRNAQAAWLGLQIETRWGDLIRRWLAPSGSEHARAA